jgi:DNA-binding PadR family transcriptional regulator
MVRNNLQPVDMPTQDYLPLTEASFFVLLSLAISPKHGYGIIKDVEAMSERRVILAAGTLYSALRRMLDDGWIERVEATPSHDDLRERKLYRLTDLGRRILEAETGRIQKLARLVQSKEAGGRR